MGESISGWNLDYLAALSVFTPGRNGRLLALTAAKTLLLRCAGPGCQWPGPATREIVLFPHGPPLWP